MTRRVPLALIALSALALTGCSTFTNVDRVATVNGDDVTRAEFDALTADFFNNDSVFGTPPVESGRGSGEAARVLLAAVTQTRVLRDLVGDQALDGARQAVLDGLDPADPVRSMSPEMQNLLSESRATETVLAGVPAPSEAELEQRYEQSPASAGVLCVRHILVDTKAEADAVIERLAAGEGFAELAAELSTDTGSGANGGIVPSTNGECWSVGQARSGLVTEFTNAAIALTGYGPSAPVESEFGWHIIEHRPWSEIAEAVVATHASATGSIQYLEALLSADVEIDPVYGTWDSNSIAVVPLG